MQELNRIGCEAMRTQNTKIKRNAVSNLAIEHTNENIENLMNNLAGWFTELQLEMRIIGKNELRNAIPPAESVDWNVVNIPAGFKLLLLSFFVINTISYSFYHKLSFFVILLLKIISFNCYIHYHCCYLFIIH